MDDWVKLSLPELSGSEMKYVSEAVNSSWITPLGPMVDEFERRLCRELRCSDVVALSSGTAAIHLGLILAGVKEGDEVICQSMTFAASANPIRYIGASPVFVDSEPSTWNIDPALLRRAIEGRIAATGRKPSAIVAVHLYGMPAMMDEVMEVARHFDIPVVEDAAEAIGSTYRTTPCGTIGNFGTLSFNGNKMITTSGGGALICPSKPLADRALFLATQAREPRPYYYHTTLGFNYRLSNVSAAIGCAQIEDLDRRIRRRRAIHRLYLEGLSDIRGVTVHCNPSPAFESNFWLSTILLDRSARLDAEGLRQHLEANRVEARRLWRPMHMQPYYCGAPAYLNGVGSDLFDRGLCLPSGASLTDQQVHRVITLIRSALKV